MKKHKAIMIIFFIMLFYCSFSQQINISNTDSTSISKTVDAKKEFYVKGAVTGYSYEGWSPIMLRLKLLYSDTTAEEIDKKKFIYPKKPTIIYTMLYLYGSIREGKLIGTWNMPYGSITALLFWPEAMSFFFEQVRQSDPDFLNQEIKMLND